MDLVGEPAFLLGVRRSASDGLQQASPYLLDATLAGTTAGALRLSMRELLLQLVVYQPLACLCCANQDRIARGVRLID